MAGAQATAVLPRAEPAATVRATPWRRWAVAAPAYVPAVMIAIAGWSHRWVDEDAFINFRILDQIFSGHGPVFNAGERVEAATSPLWLGVLVVARAIFGPLASIEWIALVASLIVAVAAFAIAGHAARRLHGGEDGVVVPVGLVLVASVTVVWDFATSGLEMGLVWLWLAASWWVLVTVARDTTITGRRRIGCAVVLGLAPLVRPELGVMMACFVIAWFVLVRPRRVVLDLVAMFALPVAYEIFRMGYYATIVPNTALAKDAGGLHVGQGWDYATDFVTPYHLWAAATLIIVVVAIRVAAQHDRRITTVTVAMLAAALLESAYIVAIGGDYMHGRLLLPAFFALGLPASLSLGQLRAPFRFGRFAVVSLSVIWALVTMVWFRPPTPAPGVGLGPAPIADWRTVSGARIVPIDAALGPNGNEARALYKQGVRGYFLVADKTPRPSKDPDAFVLTLGSIGVPAYHAGRNVWVIDIGGLAEPLAARTEPTPGRQAGHRKQVDPAWYDARFGGPSTDPKVVAARHALTCNPGARLLESVDGDLTPGRFLSNIWHSVGNTFMKVPSDPVVAEQEWCD